MLRGDLPWELPCAALDDYVADIVLKRPMPTAAGVSTYTVAIIYAQYLFASISVREVGGYSFRIFLADVQNAIPNSLPVSGYVSTCIAPVFIVCL